MNRKLFVDYSIEKLMEIGELTKEQAQEIESKALRYCTDKRIGHISRSTVSGFDMITLTIVGKKAKGNLKRGYILAYCHNFDYLDGSELGEIYVEKNEKGFFRV